MKCLECGKELKQITSTHLEKCSSITTEEYKTRHPNFSLVASGFSTGENNPNYKHGRSRSDKKCSKCGGHICIRNRFGLCSKCVDKKGKANGFYDKEHTLETKNILSEKAKSRNTKYGNTFKGKKHSENTIEHFSEKRKQWWDKVSVEDRPKVLKNLIEAGQKSNKNCKYTKIEKIVASVLDELGAKYEWIVHISTKWVDFLVDGKIIIECYGDYWHCNPLVYKDDYYHKDIHKLAKDIRKKDEERKLFMESLGYKYFVFWERDIKSKKFELKKQLIEIFDCCMKG